MEEEEVQKQKLTSETKNIKYEKLFKLWGVAASVSSSSTINANDNNNNKLKLLNVIEYLTNELHNVITNTMCNKQYYDPKTARGIRSSNVLFDHRPCVKKNMHCHTNTTTTNNNDDIIILHNMIMHRIIIRTRIRLRLDRNSMR